MLLGAGSSATSMPWWMATAIVTAWMATIGAIVAVARSRYRLARGRRPELLPPRESDDDRALPPGPPL